MHTRFDLAPMRRSFMTAFCAAVVLAAAAQAPDVRFELVQPGLFSRTGGMPNAWADFDNDGDLDLFVGFRGGANRLYRNDNGTFTDVASDVGLADSNAKAETRAAAWGDFDADGDADLYVGFANAPDQPNKIYRNDMGRFTGRHTNALQQRPRGQRGWLLFAEPDAGVRGGAEAGEG